MPKDDKKIRNIHDRRFVKPTETTSIPESPVKLSQDEAEKLSAMNRALTDARGALADACMDAGGLKSEIERLETLLETQNEKISRAEAEAIRIRAEYTQELERVALGHGIRVGDPKAGIWRHDTAAGTIVRVEQQVSQTPSTPSSPSVPGAGPQN